MKSRNVAQYIQHSSVVKNSLFSVVMILCTVLSPDVTISCSGGKVTDIFQGFLQWFAVTDLFASIMLLLILSEPFSSCLNTCFHFSWKHLNCIPYQFIVIYSDFLELEIYFKESLMRLNVPIFPHSKRQHSNLLLGAILICGTAIEGINDVCLAKCLIMGGKQRRNLLLFEINQEFPSLSNKAKAHWNTDFRSQNRFFYSFFCSLIWRQCSHQLNCSRYLCGSEPAAKRL